MRPWIVEGHEAGTTKSFGGLTVREWAATKLTLCSLPRWKALAIWSRTTSLSRRSLCSNAGWQRSRCRQHVSPCRRKVIVQILGHRSSFLSAIRSYYSGSHIRDFCTSCRIHAQNQGAYDVVNFPHKVIPILIGESASGPVYSMQKTRRRYFTQAELATPCGLRSSQ